MTRGRRCRAVLGLGGLVATLLLTTARGWAQHPGSVWETAADPRVLVAERTHRTVEELIFHAMSEYGVYSPPGQNMMVLARRLLDAVDALHAPDPRLRFDLGKVLSHLKEDARAVEAMESALDEVPDGPQAIDAYFALAICQARLGDPRKELLAYGEYLRRETDVYGRATGLSNRAEAHMVQGDLAEAIEDYRASLALKPDEVLSHWGLAVVLDRSGDRARALAEAKIALGYDPLDARLNSQDVFFVPDYDKYWYEGLGAMVKASLIDDAATSVLSWETAVVKWSSYLAAAPTDDRWVPIAKAHLVDAKASLANAQRRGRSLRRPARP